MNEGGARRPEARIFGLVRQNFPAGATAKLRADQSLQDAGLTSIDLVTLMLAVEVEFELEIPQEQMTPQNFQSVAAIRRLVENLSAAA
jgi:acyl carrier protein